jgi:transketolase
MTARDDELAALRARALAVREHILAIGATPLGTHVGGSLSAADILVALYFHTLRVRPGEPDWPERDHFVLSKGHASAALYATLAERGFFDPAELASYGQSGGRLLSHPTTKVPGVEFATGSLGHGLSLAVGLALAARRAGRPNRAFALLGDGELQEGSVWEAAMASSELGLGNLMAVVDRNGLQLAGQTEATVALEPLAARWRSFGWAVREVDGHEPAELAAAFAATEPGRPVVVLARTVKGKGLPYLQGRTESHFARLSELQHAKALAVLRARQRRGSS